MQKIQKDELISQCRIKVNKMLSSLNNNNNIFIPKYTFANKNESKYLYNSNNEIKKQNKKINSKKIVKDNNKKNKEDKKVDFIINHGVLVYQKNMEGEEIINFGINKKNKLFNNILTKRENNFNKKIIEKIKTNNNTNMYSKTFYNKNFYEKENIINISENKSFNYFKPNITRNKKSKIAYLITKIKKIYNKKIKEFFESFKFILDFTNNNKKSNSIYVNRLLTLNSKTSRSNKYLKNASFVISKNFRFFSKDSKEKELYRDSKSLEKKYEQICKRKKLNMTKTFTDNFKKNIFSNFNDNSLYTKKNPIRCCKNIIKNPNIIYNTINHKINDKSQPFNSFRENSSFKINLIENSNDNQNNKSYISDKNFSNTKKIISHNYTMNNISRKKIRLHNNISKEKSQINKYYFHSIKNICTKDKRIYIHINYLPYITQSNNNKIILNTSKVFEFNYIPKKRKKELKNDLTLIKEEEEKSKIINEKQGIKHLKKNTFIIRDKIFMNNIFINTNDSLFRT